MDSSSDVALHGQKQQELTLGLNNMCGNGPPSKDADKTGEHSAVREAAKEIIIGSIAGMVSEVFEYPFDLAKVRLQAQVLAPSNSLPQFSGPLDCLTQTWKQEGVIGMYRGLAAPIAGSMAVTAALFLSYSSFQNLFRSLSNTYHDSKTPLPLSQLGLAAAGAGGVASFVLTPIELVKCKMQVQMMKSPLNTPQTPCVPGRIPHRSPPLAAWPSSNRPPHAKLHNIACAVDVKAVPASPPGTLALIRSIVETHGVRGLWLGHTGTIFRETGGCAAWFIVKEYVARLLVERRTSASSGKKDLQPLTWESALSGAIAGAAGAVVLYPADTVKSAIQTADEVMKPSISREAPTMADVVRKGKVGIGTNAGFWSTFARMYRVHGVKGLYAGCGMTVARAIPSSGIIFMVYDGLNNYFA